jgi:hypothetical protein
MSDLKYLIFEQIARGGPGKVWVPTDFVVLGSRDAIDKVLQRMVKAEELRRIDRGLYDKPSINRLTGRPTVPDYIEVLDAIARRDQLRMLVDGMTAANDLGFTHAVAGKITVYTETRRRSIQLGNLTIQFKRVAPSRLYWAGRPAMRVVQALFWLKDMLLADRVRIVQRLAVLLNDPKHGTALKNDLIDGFRVLPIWMQNFLRSSSELLTDFERARCDNIKRN